MSDMLPEEYFWRQRQVFQLAHNYSQMVINETRGLGGLDFCKLEVTQHVFQTLLEGCGVERANSFLGH